MMHGGRPGGRPFRIRFAGGKSNMEDGHFLSFATISLGIVLFFVLSLGGVFVYLFLTAPKTRSELDKDHSN